jgi:hypothetical protein
MAALVRPVTSIGCYGYFLLQSLLNSVPESLYVGTTVRSESRSQKVLMDQYGNGVVIFAHNLDQLRYDNSCAIGASSFRAIATVNSIDRNELTNEIGPAPAVACLGVFWDPLPCTLLLSVTKKVPESRKMSSQKRYDVCCRRRYSVDHPQTSNTQDSAQFDSPNPVVYLEWHYVIFLFRSRNKSQRRQRFRPPEVRKKVFVSDFNGANRKSNLNFAWL